MSSSDTGTVKKKTGRPKGRKSGYTVSKAVIEQRKNATPASLEKRLPKTPEEFDANARLISHIMQVQEIAQQADKNDLNTLKSCFINYLKLCQVNGFQVSNLAAYASMGFGSYGQFESFIRKDDPEIRAFGSLIKSTCAMFREAQVSEGKINPVIGIFWQRNYDGLRNDTEQVQAIQEQDDETNNKGYKEKYKKLIGGD